jgi:hypothetical protein
MPKERRPAKVRSGFASGAGGASQTNGRIRAQGRATTGLTRAEARKIALAVEGASEGPYFGKPAVFVAEKFLTRVHTKEEAMVLAVGSMEMRDMMLEAEPRLFYITDHYKKFPYLLARLSKLDKTTLKELLNARLLQIEAKTRKKRTVSKPMKRKAGR